MSTYRVPFLYQRINTVLPIIILATQSKKLIFFFFFFFFFCKQNLVHPNDFPHLFLDLPESLLFAGRAYNNIIANFAYMLILFTYVHPSFYLCAYPTSYVFTTSTAPYCLQSVSYTHLDVYKRQTLHVSQLYQHIPHRHDG